MDWSVVFAIVAFAAMLQLAFFWYYLRAGQRADSVYPQAAGENVSGTGANQSSGGQAPAGDGDVIVCQDCGFDNHWDPTFTYCANCVAKLGR